MTVVTGLEIGQYPQRNRKGIRRSLAIPEPGGPMCRNSLAQGWILGAHWAVNVARNGQSAGRAAPSERSPQRNLSFVAVGSFSGHDDISGLIIRHFISHPCCHDCANYCITPKACRHDPIAPRISSQAAHRCRHLHRDLRLWQWGTCDHIVGGTDSRRSRNPGGRPIPGRHCEFALRHQTSGDRGDPGRHHY